MTLFSLLLQVCGLSQREAAALLRVRPDTVKSWSAGRNRAPEGALAELADLAGKIDRATVEALRLMDELKNRHGDGPPAVVELGISSDDAEAQSLGWPCVGAQRMVIARIVAAGMAKGYRFRVVPRGSTTATAAAADAHRR